MNGCFSFKFSSVTEICDNVASCCRCESTFCVCSRPYPFDLKGILEGSTITKEDVTNVGANDTHAEASRMFDDGVDWSMLESRCRNALSASSWIKVSDSLLISVDFAPSPPSKIPVEVLCRDMLSSSASIVMSVLVSSSIKDGCGVDLLSLPTEVRKSGADSISHDLRLTGEARGVNEEENPSFLLADIGVEDFGALRKLSKSSSGGGGAEELDITGLDLDWKEDAAVDAVEGAEVVAVVDAEEKA